MRIALDAMGGDQAPGPIVRGAVEAIEREENLHVVLVGQDQAIQEVLGDQIEHPRLEIFHCTQVIGMDERAGVLRTRRDSSIARCWELMATRKVDAVVSAGNTGAVTAAGLFTKLFLKGVKRPGIAVVLPSKTGKTVLLDVGANTNCKPEHLYQYGVMGTVYARKILNVERPTVGLMNVGSEDGKGNELLRETSQFYQGSDLRDQFFGNVEGRDLYQGTVDVIVCDGFVGNVVLKVSEGMFDYVLDMASGGVLSAIPAGEAHDTATKAIKSLIDKYHHSSFGGAPLLGIDGTCIICHGSSDEKAICNALLRAQQHSDTHLNEMIVAELERQPTPAATES